MLKRIARKCGLIAIVCPLFLSALAAADTPAALEVPAGELVAALKALARQSDVELLYQPEQLRDIRTAGLKGNYSAQEAVAILIKGTPLRVYTTERGVMVIAPAEEKASSTGDGKGVRHGGRGEDSLRLAQSQDGRGSKHADAMSRGSHESTGTGAGSEDQNAIGAVQEIIVTAQKRTERLQDVPISIAVIGNQDIERRGLIGMEDYMRSIPGVNQIDRGPADNSIVIRGITTNPEFQNSNAGATVATYFDETPITGAAGYAAGGIDVRPVDIERIEVLRGPQGTAYGSSSLSGTLRIIPAKPKLDGFSAKLAGTYSNTGGFGGDNSMIQGIFNLPVVADKLALRAVGYRYDESGFYRNIAGLDPATITVAENYGLGDFVRGYVQDRVGGAVTTGGRLAALWQPTDKLNFTLNYFIQRIEQDGNAEVDSGKYAQTRMPIAPDGRLRGEAGEVADTKLDLLNLVMNYDLGWGALTSAVSWIDGASAYNKDYSGLFAFPSSGTIISDFESFTAEARLASHFTGRFQFLGGLFYENIDSPYHNYLTWPGAPAPSPRFVTNPLSRAQIGPETDQRAVFGEASFELTHKLTATAGGRYFKYDKTLSRLVDGGLFGVPLGGGVRTLATGGDDGTTFKANLSYKPRQDALLYAGWSQGFRLGPPDGAGVPPGFCDLDGNGLIDGSNVSVESTKHVDSDFLDNYEVGAKFAFFDRRMVVDASIYHIRWNGLPIRVEGTGDARCAYTGNAGAATSDGVELQASLVVTRGLRIDFGAGYTKAEIAEDQLAQGWHAGDRLPGSPTLSTNLAAQYEFSIAGRKAFVRADSFYTGEFFGDILESPNLSAGDYIKVDARAGMAFENLSVELFVRNLTNEDAFTWRGTVQGGAYGAGSAFGFRLRPRTVGVQLSYSFD